MIFAGANYLLFISLQAFILTLNRQSMAMTAPFCDGVNKLTQHFLTHHLQVSATYSIVLIPPVNNFLFFLLS